MGGQGQDADKVCKMECRFSRELYQYLIYYTNIVVDIVNCLQWYSGRPIWNRCITSPALYHRLQV